MRKLIFPLFAFLFLAGCSQDKKLEKAATTESATAVAFTPPVVVEDAEVSASPPDREELQANGGSANATASGPPTASTRVTASPRLLIYHAEMRLKVESLTQASKRLESLVQRSGGYFSAAEETRAEDQWRQEMTIRVKPGQFSGLMAAIAALGTVENKKLSTDDVTAEHADVSARLRTKRAVEQRYVALLSQARKIQDILDIEEKIGSVREEIESTESRLKTLNDEVAYSTITLTCYQPISLPTPDAPVVSLGSRLVESFYDGWVLLMSLVVGLVSIWPLLLIAPVGIWALRRWWRKNRVVGS